MRVSAEEKAVEVVERILGPSSVHRATLLRLARGPATHRQLKDAVMEAGHSARALVTALDWLAEQGFLVPPTKPARADGRRQAERGAVYAISALGEALVAGWT